MLHSCKITAIFFLPLFLINAFFFLAFFFFSFSMLERDVVMIYDFYIITVSSNVTEEIQVSCQRVNFWPSYHVCRWIQAKLIISPREWEHWLIKTDRLDQSWLLSSQSSGRWFVTANFNLMWHLSVTAVPGCSCESRTEERYRNLSPSSSYPCQGH